MCHTAEPPGPRAHALHQEKPRTAGREKPLLVSAGASSSAVRDPAQPERAFRQQTNRELDLHRENSKSQKAWSALLGTGMTG